MRIFLQNFIKEKCFINLSYSFIILPRINSLAIYYKGNPVLWIILPFFSMKTQAWYWSIVTFLRIISNILRMSESLPSRDLHTTMSKYSIKYTKTEWWKAPSFIFYLFLCINKCWPSSKERERERESGSKKKIRENFLFVLWSLFQHSYSFVFIIHQERRISCKFKCNYQLR